MVEQVELWGFEPQTSCMPSSGNPSTAVHRCRSPYPAVHRNPNTLRCFAAVRASPAGRNEIAVRLSAAGTFPVSDIGNELDTLARYCRDRLVITVIAKHREPLALGGSGDQQINRAG